MATQPVSDMTDEQFDRHAMTILARELGAGGLARFISLHRSGPGDYTADRHQWLAGVTIEDIARELTK
ncbi:hypothetical protein SAMN05421770_107140 [Granulicella rosea]|uniref:Uncharacterized protein n=1 Tax=Granulicella rosea TaxID=474952 RepID=A0A239LLT4_9BACT|nr:hypothetical protein [Granulicella rosea]SNT31637.1 hypothetical protein SAMN05421770_107140 [Granulicella rosea]